MILDKAKILNLVKGWLTATERKNTAKIELALLSALDDMSMRIKTSALITKYEEPITSGTREKVIKGQNKDLRDIFYIKIGSGSGQKVLEARPLDVFLKNYDKPSATSGIPEYYTVSYSDDGYPVVKFDVPFESDDTMEIYYFLRANTALIKRFRSSAAVAHCTLAYFYGSNSENFIGPYSTYKGLMVLARESDSQRARVKSKFVSSDHDTNVNIEAKNLSSKRG